MTTDQRKALVQKFDNAKMKTVAIFTLPSGPDLSCSNNERSDDGVYSTSQTMSISVEDCSIQLYLRLL